MIKIKKIFLFYIFISFLNSCGGFSDAGKVLRNEKTKSTDEFLVKKRQPLTLPPEYSTLPEPESLKSSGKKNKKTIDQILEIPEEQSIKKKRSSSLEESIINQIRK